MNHIYRRIWNHAKQCWVVASESATAKGKKAGSLIDRRKAALLVLLAMGGAAGSASAGIDHGCTSEDKDFFRSCLPFSGIWDPRSTTGYASISLDATSSMAIGAGARIYGSYSFAFGQGADIKKRNSVAFGYHATTHDVDSIAIGYFAKTGKNGGHNVVVGANAFADYIGATAVGNGSKAERENAAAFGSGASATASNSVAIGANSVANAGNTVSVGSSSTKRRIVNVAQGGVSSGSADAVTGGQLYDTNQAVSAARSRADSAYSVASAAQTTANTARTNADSALSKANTLGGLLSQTSVSGNVRLGGSNSGTVLDVRNSTNANRKITGVADATLSTTSAEAVSGKQLNTTNSNVTAARSIADSAKTNADSALSKANTLSGLLSRTSASGNVRVGASNSGTVLDVRNSANASRRITGVSDATLSTTSTEAVSGKQLNATNSNVTAARSVADTAKTNADSALTKANTLSGLLSQTAASGSVRLGEKNSGTVLDVRNSANASRKITGVADATLSATSTDAVTGRQLNTTNSNVSIALSDAAAAKTTANTALTQVGTLNGLLSQGSASGNVRIGEKNSGTVLDVRNSANANRKLTGVADGVVSASSYEAVNGRQLNATNDKVTTVEGIARSAGTEAAAAKTDAAKALTETAALGGLVAQISATGNMRLGEKNSGTVLDVRNSTNESRKISGVADGLVSGDSAEAISGRQLHETNSRVSNLEISGQFLSIGTAPIIERAEAGLAGVALGNAAKAGADGGTAVGTRAVAMGRNSVAVGRGSTVFEGSDNGFALGAGAEVGSIGGAANGSVALGAGAKVASGADSSLALGQGAEAREGGVASFGNAILQRRLVNIARGTADHNATTVAQLKDSLATLGGSAGMDGNGSIIAPTYTVQGGTQNTVEDALTALDGAVITADRRADKVEGQLSSIFQDSPSARADGMSQIALNGVNGMVLTNLADGRVAPGSRDAVTGNQLYAAEQKISQNRNDLEAMRKEREMGQQAMRGLDASVIDYGGARLTGVAEAKLSADSSDVVRGSQLFRTNEAVASLADRFNNVIVDHDDLSTPAEAAFLSVAVGGDTRALGEGSTSVGSYAASLGKQSTAIGYGAHIAADALTGVSLGQAAGVFADWGVALGSYSRVEVGARFAVAVGAQSIAESEMEASFGHMSLKRRLTNIANGTANHNAATVGQLRGALSALGGGVDANGNIVGPRFNVQGQAQSTLNGALEALDGAVVTNTSRVNNVETQLRSVFQDTPSVRADGTHQLTLAGANGMVISNVANGLIAAGSRDAVNGGQLHSMQQQLNGRMDGLEQRIDDAPAPRALVSSSVPKPQTEEAPVVPEGKDSQQVASVGEGDKPTPQPKAKQDDTPKPQVDTAELEKMLARANEYTDGAISNFERRLDKMDKRFNRMAAMSSAQSAMAMNTAGLATYNRLGAGVGYSEGESAMAVGYQRVLNEKGSATFSLNGAFTNSGERSIGVGVGIGW
ncbi:ESPR-type extended signal peptide-containing protein [Stenotrophomonas maltophilia]|uniref:ESPR-type extended signal peptide-containing protein n=1 Tax=Stenotrophomonas maltophilia TaxID=40324 RepID=UPI00050A1AAF|nr:ESPR-type extended signal peptide-containing protein [Stenotrophomonas maltophilia]KGM24797.1 autotransporter [Stenotrophomonas maltophilia]